MPTHRLSRIRRRRQNAFLVSIITGLCIIFAGWFIISRVASFISHIQTPQSNVQLTPKEEKSLYQILILGYGGGNHDGTYLTDTLIVARIDMKAKKIHLISLPRDLWVTVPTKTASYHEKINSLYQIGLFPSNYPDVNVSLVKNDPAAFIKRAVTQVTGLPLDGFLAIDFAGFEKVIDILGGIDVKVAKTFTDYQYPIEGKETDTCDKKESELDDALKIATESPELAFPCRYEKLHFEKGVQHMDGISALKFARSRHSLDDGGDFARASRQQLVIEAVKAKVLSIGFIPKILPLMNELEKHLKTDIGTSEINYFLTQATSAGKYTISTYVIDRSLVKDSTSSYGAFILVPIAGEDIWTDVKRAVHQVISPAPTRIPTRKVSAIPDSAK